MAVNKVELGDETLIDLTEDTASESDVLLGKTFHLASGVQGTGSLTVPNRNFLCGTSIPLEFASNYSEGYFTQHGYYTYDLKRLSELGVEAGDYVTISFDWETTATTYGEFRAEFYRRTIDTNVLTYVWASNYIEPSATNTSGHFSQSVKLNTDNGRGTAAVIFRYNNAEQGVVRISNLKLEHGNLETPWIAAEEDGSIIGGGENILTGTNTCEEITSSGQWANGTWRKAGSGSGTITHLDIEDLMVSPIVHGWRITESSYTPNLANATLIAQNNQPVEPYSFYTISCFAKGTGYLYMGCGINAYQHSRFYLDNVTEWTRYSFVFCFSGATNIINANHRTIAFFGTTGTDSDITICGMKLEEGSAPSKYSESQVEYSTTKEVENEIAQALTNYTSLAQDKSSYANNLIPYPYLRTSSTNRGITFTVNADGSVSYSGTPSEANNPFIELKKPVLLKAGTYTLSNDSDDIYGCSNLWFFDDEACATNYTGTFTGLIKNSSGQVYLCTTRTGTAPSATNLSGYDKTFTIDSDAYVTVQARTINNTIAEAISGTIYPMLERGLVAHSYLEYAESIGGVRAYVDEKLVEATTSQAGLMSAADKTKLDGIGNVANLTYTVIKTYS